MSAVVFVLLAFAAVAVAVLAGPARPAYACSCVNLTDRQAVEGADLVVDGVADRVRRGSTTVRVELIVDAVVKGDAGDRVTVTTSRDEASCGYGFVAGQRYRVHIHNGQTSVCDGNRVLEPRAGAGAAERDGSGSTGRTLVPAAGAAAVAILAAVVFTRWRRGRRSPADPGQGSMDPGQGSAPSW